MSRSKKNVLRGLHIQLNKPQAKLITVTEGTIFDVAVDLRIKSKTFGQYIGLKISHDDDFSFLIPTGFAHGFMVLSDFADFEYKCTEYYNPDDEGCLLWSDPQLGIDWPLSSPTLSEKDACAKTLSELKI